MLLSNQVAIITGATRGIGRAVVDRFILEGATVVGVYSSNKDAADRLVADYAAKGIELRMYQGSITDAHFIATLMNDVYEAFGHIDVLVNNAGVTQDQLALMMTLEQWQHVFHTNYIGTSVCCETAIPYLLKSNRGKIVNVVSVSAVYGREAQSNYAASKGAIIGLTKLLARQYASHGLAINAIAPGMIETDMTDKVPSSDVDGFLMHTHHNRMGTSDETASTILYLASSLSEYVSGQVIKQDGGFLR
ncbi:MAG: SDR family NAD(P)-dependent oxidoreductase [Candidatus Cohnella colombiensis]|uniref:SDR family NAD(P)-dependent oxidoreductase n=1 Tax=Candidatus Cohnella colombiensis TaxID=3121368 RepID=A0AA95EXL0_9BACL|nr:MAG: SDR family NAD(P)-dependent oxidoreductase [Cohnella sp.]